MRMVKKAKRFLKKLFNAFIDARKKKWYFSEIKRQLKTIPHKVPELSQEQIKNIKEYWNRYNIDMPLQWHGLIYDIRKSADPRVIAEPVFHRELKEKMNHPAFAEVWGDKCYLDYHISDMMTVQSVLRNVHGRFLDKDFNILSKEQALAVLNDYEQLVVKPSTMTHTGIGVKLLEKPYDMDALEKEYKENYVFQLPLKQHAFMGQLNESTVNTIRVNSCLLDTEAYVMSAFVKVGQAGAFADNYGTDRYFIGIKNDGCFEDYAINHSLLRCDSIPSGFDFRGMAIPFYDRLCEAVKKAHKQLPHFGFAFWDVAINEEGEPVVVEVNLRHPDTLIGQAACGPFFGDYTEKVMEFIKARS